MYKRNNFLKLLLLAALYMVGGMSCSKNFLEVPPQGQTTEDQIRVDPNAARDLVSGVYNTLYFGGFDNTTVGFLYAVTTDVASDDADKGSFESDAPEARAIDNFSGLNSKNFYFDRLWSGYYQGIARANQALDKLNVSTFDEEIKQQLIGEVRFIRGLYYFNLVRLFGGVPLVLRVPNATESNSDEFQVKATKEKVYEAIVSDLQYGVDNLPEKGAPASQVGRATKGAAQGLLAKVYLYLKDYQKAYDLAKAVHDGGKYALGADYNIVFREAGNNSSESLFEVQTGRNTTCDAISKLYSNGQGPRATISWRNNVNGVQYDGDLGFGLNNPSADLANAYEPDDPRKNATIIFVQPTGGANTGTFLWDGFRIPTQDSVQNPRYNYKAYHSPFRETLQ
jgi:hypothetical protein